MTILCVSNCFSIATSETVASLHGRLRRFAFVLVLMFVCSDALAKDPVELKQVPISTFLGKELQARLPDTTLDIAIPVPAGYAQATFDREPNSSNWMESSDLLRANKTGDLHTENGHMVGYISTSVLYDKARDIFRGVDDLESLQAAKAMFPDLEQKRYRPNNHAALLVTATEARSGKRVYAAYIATSSESGSVIFIAFRPQENSSEIGNFVWDRMRSNLEESSHSYSLVAHNTSADTSAPNEIGEQSFADASVESRGARDAEIASAVEAAVKTAGSFGFHYDASKSAEGEVTVRAKWKGKEVVLTMLFHRKSGAIYVSSRTNQGAETFVNGGGTKIERMFYAKMHEETDRRKLRIYADHAAF